MRKKAAGFSNVQHPLKITNPGICQGCQFFHTIRGSNDFMGYGSVSSGRWIFFQDIGSFYIPDDLLAKFDNTKKTLGAQKENSHFYNLRVVEIRQNLLT